MNKTSILILIFLSIATQIFAQDASREGKPPWINGDMPELNTKAGSYKVINIDATTLGSAKVQAQEELIRDILTKQGIDVRSKSEYTINNKSSTSEGDQSSVEYHNQTSIKTKNKEVAFAKVDEYYEYRNGSYLFWILYLVSEDAKPLSKLPTLAYKSDKGAWRSVIVPGWAQFYQKRYVAGTIFLAGEVTLISTGFFFYSKYSSNNTKSKEASKVKFKQEYRNRANKYKTYSYITLGAAAAWYAYNIIDAFTSKKGRLEYDYNKMNISFYPTVTPTFDNSGACMMATVNIRLKN